MKSSLIFLFDVNGLVMIKECESLISLPKVCLGLNRMLKCLPTDGRLLHNYYIIMYNVNAQGPVYRINDTRELYFIPRDGVHDYINISLHSICGVRGIIYNCNYIIAHYHTCMSCHHTSVVICRLSIHATTTHNIPLSATMVTNTTNKLSICAT